MNRKFRKKPVVVEAVLAGEVLDDCKNSLSSMPMWILDAFRGAIIGFELHAVLINTQGHGQVRAERTDWVIRGVNGELYPCQDSVFQKTYEEVIG